MCNTILLERSHTRIVTLLALDVPPKPFGVRTKALTCHIVKERMVAFATFGLVKFLQLFVVLPVSR